MNRTIVSSVMLAVCAGFFVTAPVYAITLQEKLSGRILLQVEEKGKAWYVDPATQNRAYLGRPADAFRVMRELGLGITNTDLAKIVTSDSSTAANTTFTKRLAGKILLQVQANGEGWYVNPTDLKRYFLGRPSDAFSIMRGLGLGISNRDIGTIPTAAKYTDPEQPIVAAQAQRSGTPSSTSTPSPSAPSSSVTTAPLDFSVISLELDTKDPGGIKVEIVFSAPAKSVAITMKEKNSSELLFGMKFKHDPDQTHFGTGSSSIYAGLMPNQTYVFQVHGTDQETGRLTITAERQFTTNDYLTFFLGLTPYHESVQTDVHGLVIRRRTWDDGARWQYLLYTPVSKRVAVRLNGSTVQMHKANDLTQSEENWKLVPFETSKDVLSLYLAPNSDTLLVIDQKNQEPLTFTALPPEYLAN